MSKPVPMALPPRQPAKGEAISSVASIEQPAPTPVPVPAAPEAPEPLPLPLPPNVKALGGTIAVTVRMDVATYEALKMHGVRTRQTNQTMVLAAIKRMLGEVANG